MRSMEPDTELEHQTTAERLAALELLTANLLKVQLQAREPIDTTIFLSNTKPYLVDYRNRKHIYLLSPQGFVVSVQDLGQVTVPGNTFTLFDLPPGLRCYIVAPTGPALPIFVRCTDELLPEISPSQTVGIAATPAPTNPTQTAAAGADTSYSWTERVSHVAIQNNTAAAVFYAFDQSTTVAGNQVYVLAAGQLAVWDRQCSVLHVSSAAQETFGGQTGVSIEGFL